LLGQLSTDDRVVVADFEAGLGTVLRLADPVDVVVVVVEPTVTSLDVGRRAAEAVQAKSLGRVVVTANRVRDDDDLARGRQAFPDLDPVVVPDEPAVVAAERRGVAPLDAAPDAPGVRALVALAEQVLADTPRSAGDGRAGADGSGVRPAALP
jgi:CO dehydrogenase nickel-insertion accessory protein CooC1